MDSMFDRMSDAEIDRYILKQIEERTGVGQGQRLPRLLNEHGFVIGSQSEAIVNLMLEGGVDRRDVNTRIREVIPEQTRNGTNPNVSSLAANLLNRMKAKGYTVDSWWQLLPPEKR